MKQLDDGSCKNLFNKSQLRRKILCHNSHKDILRTALQLKQQKLQVKKLELQQNKHAVEHLKYDDKKNI